MGTLPHVAETVKSLTEPADVWKRTEHPGLQSFPVKFGKECKADMGSKSKFRVGAIRARILFLLYRHICAIAARSSFSDPRKQPNSPHFKVELPPARLDVDDLVYRQCLKYSYHIWVCW